MKRFLLFAGFNYYPEGGWSDFRGSFDTAEEAALHYETVAVPVILAKHYDDPSDCWGHTVD